MTKKSVILICLALVISIGVLAVCIFTGRKKNEPVVYEVVFEEGHTFSTDDLIKVSESQKYLDADTAEKEAMLKVVLDAMVEDGVLKDYSIDINQTPSTVSVVYNDGTTKVLILGGFSEDQD